MLDKKPTMGIRQLASKKKADVADHLQGSRPRRLTSWWASRYGRATPQLVIRHLKLDIA